MTFFSLIPVPPAAASRRLPPFPCAKPPPLPPGLTCCGLPCVKQPFLHTAQVRLRLPVCIGPLCPRDQLAAASREQNSPSCTRERVTGVLPAGCQQRAGLRSLRSLRPLPTSTAFPRSGNLYPPGPSPCPCPGVDTPARRRIPPAPAPPVCKTAFPAPESESRTFCRQSVSSGRDSVRCAHSGPSQRLRRPRCAGTCIRRAPPPARVRGWTRPPAAASRRLPSFPCAKRPFLPPGPVRCGFPCAKSPFLPPGADHGRFAGWLPAAGGTPFAALTPAPPNVYGVPATRELVSVGPLPLPVSWGGHARPPPHPASSRPSRVQNGFSCPRDWSVGGSRVQNSPSCPRDVSAAASRGQNRPLCPRDLLAAVSRVQNGPLCPRDLLAAVSRVQNGPSCTRVRITGVLPAVCQQRAGLRSLRSLRPLPTSTASPLRGNLYPSGPSPCPCPWVDTPARRRIPPSPVPPVCKTALPAPGTSSPRPPVCKTDLPAHGPGPPPPPRVQNSPSCPRDLLAAASRVQNRPLCPRYWLAAASSCAKRPFMPPGRVRRCLPGAKPSSLPPAQARHRLPGANSPFLHTGLANGGRKERQSV